MEIPNAWAPSLSLILVNYFLLLFQIKFHPIHYNVTCQMSHGYSNLR